LKIKIPHSPEGPGNVKCSGLPHSTLSLDPIKNIYRSDANIRYTKVYVRLDAGRSPGVPSPRFIAYK
jgi:hypothetical protein